MTLYANSHHFSIAPMMDWTDRHCRNFHRLLTNNTLLYTEMVTTGAIIHGDRDRFLKYNQEEHPVALQLGGCEPQALAECAKIAEDYGYDEVNINVGCPSERVQRGSFGACLMAEPNLIADCVATMQAQVKIPVTVKTRIGVDDSDEDAFLNDFVEKVAQAGCKTFIIHARKAWLKGLSPKENREIPPLNYPRVYQLKQKFPHLTISINGGIKTLDEAKLHLQQLDGVMLGRVAYHEPYLLSLVDQEIFGANKPQVTREQVIAELIPYFEEQMHEGVPLHTMLRHILGLWHGLPGARKIRQQLSDHRLAAIDKIAYLKSLL